MKNATGKAGKHSLSNTQIKRPVNYGRIGHPELIMPAVALAAG